MWFADKLGPNPRSLAGHSKAAPAGTAKNSAKPAQQARQQPQKAAPQKAMAAAEQPKKKKGWF